MEKLLTRYGYKQRGSIVGVRVQKFWAEFEKSMDRFSQERDEDNPQQLLDRAKFVAPSFLYQLRWQTHRWHTLYLRSPATIIMDYCICMAVAIGIGALFEPKSMGLGGLIHGHTPQIFMIAHLLVLLALSLSAMLAHLNIFCHYRDIFIREATSRVSSTSHFVSATLLYTGDVVLRAFVWAVLFYCMVTPFTPFIVYFQVYLCFLWAVTGWMYLIGVAFCHHSLLVMVMFTIVANGVLCGFMPSMAEAGDFLGGIMGAVSAMRWALEVILVEEIQGLLDRRPLYMSVAGKHLNGALETLGYVSDRDALSINYIMLFIMGCYTRLIAGALLFYIGDPFYFSRKQERRIRPVTNRVAIAPSFASNSD